MNINFSDHFTSKYLAEITERISGYLDKIEFRTTKDIDIVARNLIDSFENIDWTKPVAFSEKIKGLNNIQRLSSTT